MINKNIRRIIATTLAVGALSAVGPTLKEAHAATTTNTTTATTSKEELSEITLSGSSGSDITLYEDSKFDDEFSDKPEAGETYYAKTSKNKVCIDVSGVDSSKVRVFKGSKAYEIGDKINIPSGEKTTLKIRVYKENYDKDENYKSSDYTQYNISIKNTSSKDDSDEDSSSNDGNGYLKRIAVSQGYFHFESDTETYDFNVPAETNTLKIQARPTSKDNVVTIDGVVVDDDDNYVKTVPLSTGKNTFLIEVTHDGDTKTYTLNVTKDQAPISPANYVVSRGWIYTNGVWSYLDGTGSRTKGWLQISNIWYYFNEQGVMQTGWINDNGTWYYLNEDGSMAYSTVINGYQLGANGAWIQ